MAEADEIAVRQCAAYRKRGRASVLRNKDATGRAKDRIDAEELRKQKPSS